MKCSVYLCDSPAKVKGMCRPHYERAYRVLNKDKINARGKAWYLANKERHRASVKSWVARYPERTREIQQKHDCANREKRRLKSLMWEKKNPARVAFLVARRTAKKLMATPRWANEFFVSEAYDLAALRTKIMGFKWSVDHIVPLQHPFVCGLHWEGNLQVIPLAENSRKGNRLWPGMP